MTTTRLFASDFATLSGNRSHFMLFSGSRPSHLRVVLKLEHVGRLISTLKRRKTVALLVLDAPFNAVVVDHARQL